VETPRLLREAESNRRAAKPFGLKLPRSRVRGHHGGSTVAATQSLVASTGRLH